MRGLPALLVAALLPATAAAGPWTRDAGRFYVNTGYSRIEASGLYGLDQQPVPIAPFVQHIVSLYTEVGVIKRWLTASLDAQLYRRNHLTGLGYSEGVGDLRIGLWSGLIVAPFRLTAALLVGVPTGDPTPVPPDERPDSLALARSLPTGDGEWDVEGRLSFGHGFGGVRRWPLAHYVVLETGLWLRTMGFAHSFTYRAELGTRLPWRVLDRLWWIARLTGVESFARTEDLQFTTGNAIGLGNGVSYTSLGAELYGRIVKGLGAGIGIDSALRGRSVVTGYAVKVLLSYEY